MTMASRYLVCAGRELHFTEWGREDGEVVVCWHGLARTGRDFDALAHYLSSRYHVICPDTLGRGSSQWAVDPVGEYGFPFYSELVLDLCRSLGIRQMRWIGTSMGGLLGIMLAAGALAGRITHLVLNDIGPEISAGALQRIATYVGNPPSFDTLTALEPWLRNIYATFGPQTDATWRHLAETSWRRTDAGKFTLHYDPRIVDPARPPAGALDIWAVFDRVKCPTLLLRGIESDVLSRETAEAMTRRGPCCRLVEIEHCGHAPLLNRPAQQQVVAEFLAS